MTHDFKFIGFFPEEDLKWKANLSGGRLLDMAPYGSMMVAALQLEEGVYRCAVEIYSKHGPFVARSNDRDPYTALESVVRALSKKLENWKKLRRVSEGGIEEERISSFV